MRGRQNMLPFHYHRDKRIAALCRWSEITQPPTTFTADYLIPDSPFNTHPRLLHAEGMDSAF